MPRLIRHHAHFPVGVTPTLDVPDRHLFSHLANSAERTPDKPAIHYYGRLISYRELHTHALALAGYLQQRLGVRSGERVLLLMQNCPHFVIAYYAALRCDAVVVAMNAMSTPEEIAYYASDSGARILITTQDMMDKAQSLLDSGHLDGCVVGAACEFVEQGAEEAGVEMPAFVLEAPRPLACAGLHIFSGALSAGIAPTPMRKGGPDLAVVAYTSGTTGKPKGAMLTHRNFAHASVQRSKMLSEEPEQTELVVLPISHLAGMNIMNLAIYVGRTVVLLSRWDADAVLTLIERQRVYAWGAVAPMLAEVFSRPDIGQRDLSSLKRLYGGATAMPEALIRRIEERLALSFIESYGMTELCGASHLNPPQAARRQCGGIPHINCDARVIDLNHAGELGPGMSGEIVMHAPTMFDGYWNKPEATAETLIEIDGKRFMRSGDIGHYDEDGYFYVTDRLKRMINAAGLKIWPAEIESALYGHPAVQEACVISAFDTRRGETVKAFVVLRPAHRGTVSPEDIMEWARSHLSAYKVPRIVEFVDALPKTGSGKTLWRALQAQQDERDGAARAAASSTA